MNAFTRAFTQFLSLIIPTKKRNVYRPQFDDRSNLDPDIDTVVSAVQSCEGGNWRPFCMMVKQMMTDGHIMTELSKRKLAVLGDPLSFKPASKAAVDVAAGSTLLAQALGFLGHAVPDELRMAPVAEF